MWSICFSNGLRACTEMKHKLREGKAGKKDRTGEWPVIKAMGSLILWLTRCGQEGEKQL